MLEIPSQANIPYLSEYFGVWAMQDADIFHLWQMVCEADLQAHVLARSGNLAPLQPTMAADGAVGIVPIKGTMMKNQTSMGPGASTVEARRAIRNMAADESVKSIMLNIDSPGGTVAGTRELANDIYAARNQKPVITYFEDAGASAAYWAGSQGTHVFSNATAGVGGIGTYAVVHDVSKAAEKAGVNVHVIKAGDFKGLGTPGTEINDKVLGYLNERVQQYNQFFLEGVEQGRDNLNADQVAELATGQTYIGESARQKGLIDQVMTFDDAVAFAADAGKSQTTTSVAVSSSLTSEETSMSNTTEPVAAATLEQIQAACPKADDSFVLAQLKAGATLDQVRDAYAGELERQHQEQMAALEARIAAAESTPAPAEPAPAPAPTPAATAAPVKVVDGAPPAATSTSALDAYNEAVLNWMDNHPGCTPFEAQDEVEKRQPNLRMRMLQEVNGADFTETRPEED